MPVVVAIGGQLGEINHCKGRCAVVGAAPRRLKGKLDRYYASEATIHIQREVQLRATGTSTGRITIPKQDRELLEIEPGSVVGFERAEDGRVAMINAKGARRPSRFADFRGHAGKGPCTDEIMALLRGKPSERGTIDSPTRNGLHELNRSKRPIRT